MENLEKTKYQGIYYKRDTDQYIVNLCFKREKVFDVKKNRYVMKQRKERRTAGSLKEALAIKREHETAKTEGLLEGHHSEVTFQESVEDYIKHNTIESSRMWSMSYEMRQWTHATRVRGFLIDQKMEDKPVRKWTTSLVEDLFFWSTAEHTVMVPVHQPDGSYTPELKKFDKVGYVTLEKTKSFLEGWNKYLLKNFNRYGVSSNFVALAEIPGVKRQFQPVTLTEEQLNDLIRYALDYEVNSHVGAPLVLITLGALCGMRRGEMMGLKWSDIIPGDEEKPRRIHVVRQRMELKGGIEVIKVPKGGRDDGQNELERKERYTALSDKAYALLMIVKEEQERYHKVKADDFIYQEPDSMAGNYLPSPRHTDRRWREFLTRCNKVARKAGREEIPFLRVHDLRHTFAMILRDNGISNDIISYNLGHVLGGNITPKVYLHDDGLLGRQAVCNVMDQVVTTDIARHDYNNQ